MLETYTVDQSEFYPTYNCARLSDGTVVEMLRLISADYPPKTAAEMKAIRRDTKNLVFTERYYKSEDYYALAAEKRPRVPLPEKRVYYLVELDDKSKQENNGWLSGNVYLTANDLSAAKRKAVEISKRYNIKILGLKCCKPKGCFVHLY